MRFIFLFLIAVCFIPTGSYAQPEISPGEYITERGWGNLKIKKDIKGGLSFEIDAVGGNAHTCSLSGEIKSGKSVLEGSEKDKPCIVSFTTTGKGINVTDNENACRYYCGARAGFTGLYLKPQKGCDSASMKKTRKEFKRLYDKREFALARVKLEQLLKTCSDIIDWTDLGWIRNDLAITLYKLRDYSECRRVLQPLEEDAKQSDDELRESYPPADAYSAIPIARATRTNLKLCSQVNNLAEQAKGPDPIFKPALEQIKGQVMIPVLLPSKLPESIHPSEIKVAQGLANEGGYEIYLSYGDCGNACFAANFIGSSKKVQKIFNTRPVKLPNGIKARFRPVSCGGSCAPANLWWEQDGAMYQIQMKLNSDMSEKMQEKVLVETASSMPSVRQ